MFNYHSHALVAFHLMKHRKVVHKQNSERRCPSQYLDGVEDANAGRQTQGGHEDDDVSDAEGVAMTGLEAVPSVLHGAGRVSGAQAGQLPMGFPKTQTPQGRSHHSLTPAVTVFRKQR